MDKSVNISDIIAPNYYDIFNDKTTRHQILLSGRASTKTSFNCIKIAYNMINERNMDIVVIRQIYDTHRDSTFKEIIQGFSRLGVKLVPGVNYGRGRHSSLYISYEGNYIHFKGLNDVDALLGLTTSRPENKFKIIYFFEYRAFKDETDTSQVISTYLRGNPDWFICIWESNPHANSTHWSYEFRDKMLKRPDAWIRTINYLDLPEYIQRDWLGQPLIDEIDMLKLIDIEQYKYIYLGLPAKLNGAIYKRFDYTKHVKNIDIEDIRGMRYVIGVDYGTHDATVFEFGIYHNKLKKLSFVKEYYHKNGVSIGEKVVTDYAKDLLEFVNECYNMVKVPITVIIDESEKSFIDIVRPLIMMNLPNRCVVKRTMKNRDNEIINRISVFNLMLGSGYVEIDKSCKYLIKSIDLAEYDKNGKRKDNTTTHYTDALDAGEYVWIDLINKIRNVILPHIKM